MKQQQFNPNYKFELKAVSLCASGGFLSETFSDYADKILERSSVIIPNGTRYPKLKIEDVIKTQEKLEAIDQKHGHDPTRPLYCVSKGKLQKWKLTESEAKRVRDILEDPNPTCEMCGAPLGDHETHYVLDDDDESYDVCDNCYVNELFI